MLFYTRVQISHLKLKKYLFYSLLPRRSKVRFAPTYFLPAAENKSSARFLAPPFRKKSRSAHLFDCKRPHDGSLSLPTFCEFERVQLPPPKCRKYFFMWLRHFVEPVTLVWLAFLLAQNPLRLCFSETLLKYISCFIF